MPDPSEPTRALQAVLLALSDSAAYGPIAEHIPEELMPLVNQPFIARVVAALVGAGIKELTVLVCNRADLFSAFLGDGSRWGCKIKVVAVPAPAQACARLPELITSDCVLIGSGSTLPFFDAQRLAAFSATGARLRTSENEALGWQVVPRALCGEALRACRSLDELDAYFGQAGVPQALADGPVLRCISPQALLASTRLLLDERRPDQTIAGHANEKGVYLSRNVVLHPTVAIRPPVVIAADCKLDPGVEVGPYVVIGEKTILGNHTTLENAVVFPETYIGPHLELKDAVVDHNCLAYGDGKGAVPVPDPFLLSVNQGHEFGHTLRQIYRRVSGTLVLLVLWPFILALLLLALVCRVKQPLRRIKALRLPATFDPAQWQTFSYFEFNTETPGLWQRLVRWLHARRWPTIWNVACGQASWVGLRPLTPEQVQALPPDWRQFYRGGRVGIVRLAELDQLVAGESSEDLTYSSEAFYVVMTNLRTDLSIVWRALWVR